MVSNFQAVQAGDPQAMAHFVAAHEAKVQKWVGGMMRGCGADVLDVVQDTFIEVLLNIRSVHGGTSSVTPWMRQVAHNVVCRYFRRQHYRNILDYRDPRELELGTYPSPSDQTRDLKRALALLPEEEAEVLVRYHLEGAGIPELAFAFSTSESTIKRRLRRGTRRIRTRLGETHSRK